ncbi:N-acylglucosamine 2-epimerase [Desulfovibrio sp. X2]|uniref:thioredoxin domain-containing protein n=1 Tax=Desulfovibrio sp. X2 TaxID=941449 RepID=UPI000358C1C0|nr:thioredoxin domain-containing protein [Desulfovibrio sp. X2]EPR44290.1 N-acylglucosamine 2-epimerase [Desulfovibrio sp. X2]
MAENTERANRLAGEKSPYLLQHAQNPVDWRPWGEEAFAEAKAQNKPLFVSIGYSTCHWCHVMAHESFEDEDVAALMNAVFVNVKVDREERPDVDSLYMTACQILTGGGGWPLNVVLTPGGEPFFAATYIPKQSLPGRMGMLDLVPRLAQIWSTQHEEAASAAAKIVGHLREIEQAGEPADFGHDVLDRAAGILAERFDAEHGGFGTAPKFPSPHQLLMLLRHHRASGDAHSLGMVRGTLVAMRLGGLWDHVGFGFHRYSTDARWLLPHFEKMLYDQAMMLMAYTEAWQVTGEPLFAQTAREIAGYVLRDLRGPLGAFLAAEDADSEGQEGLFYVWRDEDLDAALDLDAEWARELFGVLPEGNFEDEARRERTGANVLHLSGTPAELAARLGMGEKSFAEKFESVRSRLLLYRSRRPRPHMDDKVLTDWNGLMIAALAKAARAFEPSWAREAARAADFILSRLRMPDGRLLHRWRENEAAVPGLLADHAFLAWGLLELAEATGEPRWLREATSLARILVEDFDDAQHGGFFQTPARAVGEAALPVRQKDIYDAAMPSGNSAAVLALARLSRITGQERFRERAEAVAGYVAGKAGQRPDAFAMLLCGLSPLHPQDERGGADVVVVGKCGAEDTQGLLAAYGRTFAPDATLVFKDPGDEKDAAETDGLCPAAEGRTMLDGRATAYVCRARRSCEDPVHDPEALAALLRKA